MLSPVADRFLQFFQQDRAAIREGYDPYLYSYYRKLFTDPPSARSFLRWTAALARHARAKGGRLLDAGCGFGITCFGFLASPDAPATVVGLDPSEGKVTVMRKMATFMGLEEGRLEPVQGDALALPFDAASFDAVFVKDVASHVRDRELFWSEIARVLKKGGRLVFTDENNALSFAGRRERAAIWKSAEEGPLPADSWMARPYREERRLVIDALRPDLSEAERAMLAVKSMGMWGEELSDAVRAYQSGGVFTNTADFPYRSPTSGEYTEYLFSPFTLARDLSAYGLRARVIRPMYRSRHPLKALAGSVIAATHPASIIVQSSFYLVAVRE